MGKIFLFKISHIFLWPRLFVGLICIQAQDASKLSVINPDSLYNGTYEYDTLYLPPDTIRVVDTIVIIEEDFQFPDWSFDVWFSPFVSFGKAHPSRPQFDSTANLFNQYSSHRLNYSAGINITRHFNYFAVVSGLHLFSFQDNFTKPPTNLFIEDITFFKLDTIDTRFNVFEGDTTYIYETDLRPYSRTDSAYLQTPYINRHMLIEIPVQLGYSFYLSNIMLEAHAGLGFAILANKNRRHLLIDKDNKLIDATNLNYLNRFFISSDISLGIFYYLPSNFAIFANCRFRYQFNSFTKDISNVRYNPSSMGISIGLRYSY